MKTLKFIALLSATALLFSCSSNKYDETALGTGSDSVSVTRLTGDSVKLIKTADVDFRTDDVHQSARNIVKAVHSFKGIVSNRQINAVQTETKELQLSDTATMIVSSYVIHADMEVRIPSAKLDTFIEEVYSNALMINSINIKIEDKSLDYLATKLKQQNRQQAVDRSEIFDWESEPEVSKAAPDPAVTAKADPVSKQSQLLAEKDALVDQEIANRQINADMNYSTVHLTFTQHPLVRQEIVPDANLNSYQLPFKNRFANAFMDGWQYFLSFTIAMTSLWMFIVLGIAFVYGYRYYKIKKFGLKA